MAADINDKFTKVAGGAATTLDAPGYTIGATSINLVSSTNWPTDTAVFFTIYKTEIVDGLEAEVAGTRTFWKGVVNLLAVEDMTLVLGNDQNYAAGSNTKVDIVVSDKQHNTLIDGLLTQHNQDGSHKDLTTNSLSVDGTTFEQFPSQFANFYDDGAVWSQTTGLNASMTSGHVWYGGKRYAVASIGARAFTASKDTYVDIDPTTGTPTYIEANNGAAAPALTSNTVRVGFVTTSAGAVTGFTPFSRKPVTSQTIDLPYSTTEHLTGRTWIDGKHEYEKTVTYDSGTGTTHNYTHGISLDTPISCIPIASAGTINITTPPIVPADMNFTIGVFLTRTTISIRRGSSAATGQVIMTIRYTKT